MVSLGRPHPERMGFCFIGCGIYFNQRPILYGAVSPTHGSENQGVKMDLVLLTIILNNPFVEFLLLILATLSSAEYIFGLFNSRLHISCSFEHKYMLYIFSKNILLHIYRVNHTQEIYRGCNTL